MRHGHRAIAVLLVGLVLLLASLALISEDPGFTIIWGAVYVVFLTLLIGICLFPLYFYFQDRQRRERRAELNYQVVWEGAGERLVKDSSGRFVLCVLCGGIGQFELCVALSAEELEEYRKSGSIFLHTLALRMAKSPQNFSSRAIESPA